MYKSFTDDAWEDYCYWQNQDKKTLRRINLLLKDIERNGYEGIGKPEPLSGDLAGYWSRRIDDYNRIVYRINNNIVEIIQCGTPSRKMRNSGKISRFFFAQKRNRFLCP